MVLSVGVYADLEEKIHQVPDHSVLSKLEIEFDRVLQEHK